MISEHATYLVGLWIDNDYGTYKNKIHWLDRASSINHRTVRAFVEDLGVSGLEKDLHTHELTMDHVDWMEIACDWEEELKEREENA